MDLDRQAIERKDFPIGRRGYETAAVDAHLRALAAEFEELERRARGGSSEGSLAAAASSQVQSIIAAAESAAADIERQASEDARRARDEAHAEAARTRDDAVDKARAHVAAVSRATGALLERVGSMDGELGALLDGLRGGGSRLSQDLVALKTGMGELYDAAAGASGAARRDPASQSPPGEPAAAEEPAMGHDATPGPLVDPEPAAVSHPVPAPAAEPHPAPEPAAEPHPAPEPAAEPRPAPAPAAAAPASPSAPAAQQPAGGDLDGARLIALNMALNGESREETERYLAENFQLEDRAGLVAEVYAAIEG